VNTKHTFPTLLILALHGGEQSDSRTSCLTLREESFLQMIHFYSGNNNIPCGKQSTNILKVKKAKIEGDGLYLIFWCRFIYQLECGGISPVKQ
jgi:hypothetical protein